MRRSSLLAAVFVVFGVNLAAPSAAPAANAPPLAATPTLDKIKRTGTLTLAYRDGAPPFSYKDRSGQVQGYSVELCKRVAAAVQKDLGLSSLKVDWVPVLASARIGTVATGLADAECGTTTVTIARMHSVDFSVPIFVDGGSVLVQTKSKLARLGDLAGRRVAVIAGTTTERSLRRAFSVQDAPATLVPVKDGREGVAMLARGAVDGYAGDRLVLAGLRDGAPAGSELEIIDGDFSVELYALVLPRNDPDFRLIVNRTLVELYRSGEVDTIFQRWLAGLGRPGPLLHALFYLNTLAE